MRSRTRTILAVLSVFGVVAALVAFQIVFWMLEAREIETMQAESGELMFLGAPAPPHTPPLEEMILDAGAVARVRFVEAEARTWERERTSDPYVAYMALKFEVLEYLKGGAGLDTIWGGLGLEGVEGATEQEALDKARRYLTERDTRWDDREAIIIFQQSPGNRDDLYSLGWVGGRSAENPWRRWLPAAAINSGASGTSGEPEFLWDDTRRSSGASGTSEGTVTLTELKGLTGLSDIALEKRIAGTYGFPVIMVEDIPAETGIYLLSARSYPNRINLEWSALGSDATGITGYRILRRKQSDAEFVQLADILADDVHPKYEDTRDIEPETKYIYRIRAYAAAGDVGDAEVSITSVAGLEPLRSPSVTPTPSATPKATPTAAATPAVAPSALAPQNLTATATRDSVTLSWDAPADASALRAMPSSRASRTSPPTPRPTPTRMASSPLRDTSTECARCRRMAR